MSGEQLGGLGMGALACLLGLGGIAAALARRRRRAEIAPTYGSTGGVVFTALQIGCSGLLILGGLALIVIAFAIKR